MNVLITGDTSGLGLELKRLYEAQGHTVFGMSRKDGYDLNNIYSIHAFCEKHKNSYFDTVILNAATAGIEYGRETHGGDYQYWTDMMRINCINQAVLLYELRHQVTKNVGFVSADASLYPRMLTREKFDKFSKLAYMTTKVSVNMTAMYFSRMFREMDLSIPVVLFTPSSIDTQFEKQYTAYKPNRHSPLVAAEGIKQQLDNATMDQNGKFYSYTGEQKDW